MLPLFLLLSSSVAASPVANWLSASAAQVPILAPYVGEERSIYQVITTDLDYTNLTKAIKFSGEPIIKRLSDTAAGITFFAVPDSALHHPHKDAVTDESRMDLATAVSLIDEHEAALSGGDDDEEKKRRKEMFRKIVTAILSYHILPQGLQSEQLSKNSTFATDLILPDGSFDKKNQRIKVSTTVVTHAVIINMYANVLKPDVAAKNGVIHVLDHPLLPPPSVFQCLFGLPSIYSILTSALQRTEVAEALERRWVHGKEGKKGSIEGVTAVTAFAPSNKAFEALPIRLRAFLFSPFGERILGKVLAYHVVPGKIVFSDYSRNVSSKSITSTSEKPIFKHTIDLPTLLPDHIVVVDVAKYKIELPIHIPGRNPDYRTDVLVNGQTVTVADVPARNGAIHGIDELLDPRGKKPDFGLSANWEDWEDWLVEWAESV